MKFRSLQMHNFGPYKGDNELRFPDSADRNVVVIFGDNMRGKTSLLNALRWILFGRALNRQRQVFPLVKLLNRDAQGAGDWSMSVTLRFDADGNEYELHRSVNRRDLVQEPRSDADFEEVTLLRRNGQSFPASAIEREINHFIPEQIARFYLFDADVLQEYELLLIESSEQARTIKDAIEKVLGVPALTNARDDCRTLLKRAQNLLANQARYERSLEAQARMHMEHQARLDILQTEETELQGQLLDTVSEIGEVDKELRETQSIQHLMVRKRELEQQRDELEADEAHYTRERLMILRDAWQDMLFPILELKRVDVEREIAAQREMLQSSASLDAELASLEAALTTSHCKMCGQELPTASRTRMEEQRAALHERRAALTPSHDSLASLNEQFRVLTNLRSSNARQSLQRLDESLARVTVTLTRIEGEIETVEDRLRGHPLERISHLQRQRDQLLTLRGKQESTLEGTRREVETIERKREGLTRVLTKESSPAMRRTSLECESLEALSLVFGSSIGELRDALRRRVAREASKVFLELTTEKTYRELIINDNYGLTIIDGQGRTVDVRSAGAEQVVAMALLAALNRTAGRSAPVVIDTPFARLDPIHRTNIMKFVPTMAEQVVFLVHEGELPKAHLGTIGSRIGAVYQIDRESSSHSRLLKVQEH